MKKLLQSTINIYSVNIVKQTEKRTGVPLVPDRSYFDVQIYVDKLKIYQQSGIDQIQLELIQEGSGTVHPETQKCILPIQKTVDVPEKGKDLV
jgi:hypothetical protein